jgi:hypothetical protein
MRFNPPPNWPPGWPLWVPDARRRNTGLVVGGLAAALLVIVGVVVAIVATTNGSAGITVGRPTATSLDVPAPTDEQQVRDVIDQFEQAWNDEDVRGLRTLFCADMRTEADFDEGTLRDMVRMGDDLILSIAELDIDGDAATATILNRGKEPDDIGFVREDGAWKWCQL